MTPSDPRPTGNLRGECIRRILVSRQHPDGRPPGGLSDSADPLRTSPLDQRRHLRIGITSPLHRRERLAHQASKPEQPLTGFLKVPHIDPGKDLLQQQCGQRLGHLPRHFPTASKCLAFGMAG